jgi:hypothetical protein
VLCVAAATEAPIRVRVGRIHAEGGRSPDSLCVSDRVLCAAGAVGATASPRQTTTAAVS